MAEKIVTSAEAIAYYGQVAAWLKTAPEKDNFYVGKVTVTAYGDEQGTFVNDDPDWLFEHGV